MPELTKFCSNNSPPWFTSHWRDWHRGHGCDRDDGKPRAEAARVEIEQHAGNQSTGYLTDAELRFLRASTTAGNVLLVRALDELATRRAAAPVSVPAFDHSRLDAKHFEPQLGYCCCPYCKMLPACATPVPVVERRLVTRCSAGHLNNGGASWCSECGEACSTTMEPP